MGVIYNSAEQYFFIKNAAEAGIPPGNGFRAEISDGRCKIYDKNQPRATILLSDFQKEIDNYRFNGITDAVEKTIRELTRAHNGYGHTGCGACCPPKPWFSDA